jgi:hypothetical protein
MDVNSDGNLAQSARSNAAKRKGYSVSSTPRWPQYLRKEPAYLTRARNNDLMPGSSDGHVHRTSGS